MRGLITVTNNVSDAVVEHNRVNSTARAGPVLVATGADHVIVQNNVAGVDGLPDPYATLARPCAYVTPTPPPSSSSAASRTQAAPLRLLRWLVHLRNDRCPRPCRTDQTTPPKLAAGSSSLLLLPPPPAGGLPQSATWAHDDAPLSALPTTEAGPAERGAPTAAAAEEEEEETQHSSSSGDDNNNDEEGHSLNYKKNKKKQ
jgi:hypothetical protein